MKHYYSISKLRKYRFIFKPNIEVSPQNCFQIKSNVPINSSPSCVYVIYRFKTLQGWTYNVESCNYDEYGRESYLTYFHNVGADNEIQKYINKYTW